MFCSTKTLRSGPGVPLVFLHGFLGSSADWEPVLSHLSSCQAIGVDLPGHGDSPFFPVFDFPPPAPRFHLIGYSMGGRLALQYALRFPERVAQLVIASAHPGLSTQGEREKRLASDAKWAKELRELPIDDFLDKWYNQPLFANFKPDRSLREKQNIPELATALMHYSLGNQLICKVENALYIVGEKDAKFRALYPNAIVIPNAGHAVHLEKPQEFARVIRDHAMTKSFSG